MKKKRTPLFNADGLGIIASAICFVHCMLTPIVFSLLAVWAHALPAEEKFHRIMALMVAAIGSFAMVSGYRRHRRPLVIALMSSGIAVICVGAYCGDRLPSHLAEVAVTMMGSCFMISAHLLNHTFCQSCARCADPVCSLEDAEPGAQTVP
jgi:hypothetical protein